MSMALLCSHVRCGGADKTVPRVRGLGLYLVIAPAPLSPCYVRLILESRKAGAGVAIGNMDEKTGERTSYDCRT